MPTDSRRFTGPEETYSPYDFCTTANSKLEDENLQPRFDERSSSRLRPVFLKAGVVSQAKGSAYIEMDQTKVVCAVYGPREVSKREDFSLKGQLTCDFKFLTFSCSHRRQHQQDEQEKDLSVRMLEALEAAICLHKYPKSQINVYLMVIQNDGSALTAAITCASVALASAGVEMYDLVLASSVAIKGSQTLADPTAQEEEVILRDAVRVKAETCAGNITVAFLPSINQVSAVSTDGYLLPDTVKQNLQICIGNCQKVYSVVRQCLVTYLMETRKHVG